MYGESVTVIEAQGQLLRVKRINTAQSPMRRGAVRGKVVEFSQSARKRLMRLFARMKATRTRVVFVTLTFNGTPTFKESKMALKRFLMRVRRKWQSVSGVWRMEVQKRGSVHFHVIFFGLPYWKQSELQQCWTECTREDVSIADVRLVKGHRMLMAYVSKYVAKRGDGAVVPAEGAASLDKDAYQHDLGDCGQWYGVFNEMWLPFAPVKNSLFRDEQLTRYLFWSCRAQSYGKCGYDNTTAYLFTEDCYDIFDHVALYADEFGLWLNRTISLWREFGLDMERGIFRFASQNF